MPNLIPDWEPWMRPAGRLIWAVFLFLVGLAVVGYLIRRPKPDRPATWAECMAGAVATFGLMILGYAVIPSEWITYSDKYLQWDTTKFVFRANQKLLGLPVNWPFNFTKQALRDIIVVVIYVVVIGLNLRLFAMWQNRGKPRLATAEAKPRTSRFGRPLRRREPASTSGEA